MVGSPAKVCLISSGLIRVPPEYGGAVERHVFHMARNMRLHGVEVDVIDAKYSSSDPDEEGSSPKIRRIKKPFSSESSVLSELAFGLAIRRTNILEGYSLIHANTAIPGLFALRLRGNRPFVYTCHRSSWVSDSVPFASRCAQKFEACIMRRATAVVAVSEELRRALISSGRVPQDRICCIPNGVDTEFFRPDIDSSEDLKASLGLSHGRVILFVGRLCSAKGVDVLIQAFHRATRAVHPEEAKLVIVGPSAKPDAYISEVMANIAQLGLRDSVLFLSDVSSQDLAKVYSMSDIFVLPSRYEAMPLALLEAMASGKPLVGSRIGGIADIIDDGFNGFTFECEDAETLGEILVNLLIDDSLRRRLGSNSRHLAEREYDWSNLAKRLLTLYEDLLTGGQVAKNLN